MNRKKLHQLLILLLVLTLATAFFARQLIRSREFQIFGELVHRVDTDDNVIALTFDDGPTTERTRRILHILEAENTKATFFLNGKPMQDNPTATKLIIQSGHQIGNHGYSHRRMLFMSYSSIAQEIESTAKVLNDYGYKQDDGAPLLFRPPYGNKFIMLPYYLDNNDITTIIWDIEPETHKQIQFDSDAITNHVVSNTKPGSIVLLHVMYGSDHSINSVTPIIRQLKAKGYQFVTLNELLKRRTIR